ncbi:MAG TPA: hypothetical protein VKA37_06235 [Halobacteriales archaeon]|nr:hypothetical protein [Halobacteriales archaeon]
MRAVPAALLVASVVLAGCSGFPLVGEEGGSTPVAPPIPEDQVTSQPPPGILSLQVVNPGALGRAHARAIENESYLLTSNRTVVRENGTLRSRLAVTVAIDEERRFLAAASTDGPEAPVFLGTPPVDAVYWSNGTTYARRLSHDGRTTHTQFAPPETWVGTWSYWTTSVPFGGRANRPETYYASLFSAVPTRVTGETTIAGTTVFRLENEADRPFSNDTFPGRVDSVHDVSFVALVDGDGLVRSLDLRYAGTVDGEAVRVNQTIRYEDVGSTTVRRPAWYERAASG